MAQFLNDTFTNTAGVALTSHTGEAGATWTYNTAAYSSSNAVITDANRLRNNYFSPIGVSLAYASGNSINANYSVSANVYRRGTVTGFAGVAGRMSTSANTMYFAVHDNTGFWVLWKNIAGTSTKLGEYAETLTADTNYKVTLSMSGTTIKLLVNDVERVSVTDSAISTAGKAGVVLFSPTTAATNTNGYHLSDVRADDISVPVNASAVLSSISNTAIALVCTASNGTPAYSYQWYRGTTANFTPGVGNILSGQTSATLTDTTAVANTLYWYKCIVTDSLSQTATTNPIAAQLWSSTLRIGFLGDSITNGYLATSKPGTLAADLLERSTVLRQCTATNQGVNGTRVSDWISGSSNLVTAKAAFASAGVTHVVVTLGTNDTSTSVSNSTYLANMTSLVNDLVAAGYVVILNSPPGYSPNQTTNYDSAAVDRLVGYASQLDSLVNGTTILRGDKLALQYFSGAVSELLSDGVHFTDAGNATLADFWANAILSALSSAVYPTAAQVLTGVSFGPSGTDYTGTIVLPDVGNVRSGITFGPSSASTGTLALPLNSQVLLGVAVGNTTGNVVLPSAANVRTGTAFGPASATVGTCAVPSASEVLLTVAVDSTTGTVRLPSASRVINGVVFGASDALTGSFVSPTVGQVQSGVTYGSSSEFVGTLSAGGSYTAAANVRFGTDRGDGVLGTLRVPSISQVQNGVPVDAGVGLLTVPNISGVRFGLVYGAPFSPLVGSLRVPSASEVLLGVAVDATTGTVRLPPEANVLVNYAYGASDTLTGTLTGSAPGFALPVRCRVGVGLRASQSIVVRLGETPTIQLTAVDASDADVSLDSLTLTVVFEGLNSTADVATVANGSITKSSNVATFSLPSAVSQDLAGKKWTMRASDGTVIGNGFVKVINAAVAD